MQAISFKNEKFKLKEPFKGLFTQGMVCHETYKDSKNNWISPDDIQVKSGKKVLKNNTDEEIKVGPSESMSKSKKNTIDPEKIIDIYGADSVRLFILSDSPPEKDVQWSDDGIASSYKFLQKLWALNVKFIDEIKKDYKNDYSENLTKYTHKFIKKMTNNMENFNYNILIANLHEMQSYLMKEINNKYSKETLFKNYNKILVIMMPIIPHFSNECIKQIGAHELNWPNFDESILTENIVSFVIQIQGKKRGLISAQKDITEKDLLELIKKENNLNKYLKNKEIKKIIFVPQKLINIII